MDGYLPHLADSVKNLRRCHGDLLRRVVLRDSPNRGANVQAEIALDHLVKAVLGHARAVDEVEAAPVDDSAAYHEGLARFRLSSGHEGEGRLDLGRCATVRATAADVRRRAQIAQGLASKGGGALAQRKRAGIEQV